MEILENVLNNIHSLIVDHTVACRFCLCATITATALTTSAAVGVGVGVAAECVRNDVNSSNSTAA